MADNVPITAGSGTNIATDQVAGTLEHVQLFKLAYSADGVRTLVPVDADGLLVNLGANNDVTVSSASRTATGTLGALNDAAQVSIEGMAGVGVFVATSTLVGTLTFELSTDGGTTWLSVSCLNESTLAWSTTAVNPASNTGYTAALGSHPRLFRVRVSAYTSGSAAVTLVSSAVVSPLALAPMLGVAGSTSPFFLSAVCGVDGAGVARAFQFRNSAPGASDYGLATREVARGQATMANSIPMALASDQSNVNVEVEPRTVLFRGRASTFNTPGRAGTAGQKILTIHNATGSTVVVKVRKIVVDLAVTVVKAITVPPPMVRVWKFTAAPTNGTALTKNKIGGTTTSSASVVVTGDASADGTGSGTTLTVTLPAGSFISQEYAGRFITAAGYEPADRMEFVFDEYCQLNALEGLCVFLDYTAANQNPTTDRWMSSVEWTEE